MNLKRLGQGLGIGLLAAGLCACGSDDRSSPGGETGAPAAPSDLNAELLAGPAIHVTWKDNSADEDSFVLERKVHGGEFSVLTSPPFNENAHHDADVMAATMYMYRIAAKNAEGVSAYSNEASVTVP